MHPFHMLGVAGVLRTGLVRWSGSRLDCDYDDVYEATGIMLINNIAKAHAGVRDLYTEMVESSSPSRCPIPRSA